MLPRLFFPFIKISRNRIFINGRANQKLLILGFLGVGICIALYLATWKTVSYFQSQNELGVILSMKIFQMAWITIFAMLIFSSMITGISTLYLSHDNECIISSPVELSELYEMRLVTTFLNTSWMVLIFSIPIFAAFGVVFAAGPLYWPLLIVSIPATALTATGSALLVTIVLVYLFPARRTKDIIFYLTLCFGIFLYLIFRLMRPENLVNPEKYGQFVEYLSAVSNPAGPWMPAGWTANLLTTYLLDRQIDWLLLGLVVLTPFVMAIAGQLLMGRLFIPGFSKSQESFGGNRHFKPSPNSTKNWVWIFRKETISFLRDSKEWSQFFMIAALVVVYLYNFKVLPLERVFGSAYVANLIAFGNIGLTGFISASLAARFVYPSIGAEGGAIYLISSSPLSPWRFMWYKYLFYVIPFTALTLILVCVSNYLLQISTPMWWISIFSSTLICWTAVAMALGFGAIFADYNAENRAASMGPGAVFFLFCAISYMLLVIFLGFAPTYRLVRGWMLHASLPLFDTILVTIWAAGAVAISILIAAVICRKAAAALLPK
jgi:ABC-2 type transport system permease protein